MKRPFGERPSAWPMASPSPAASHWDYPAFDRSFEVRPAAEWTESIPALQDSLFATEYDRGGAVSMATVAYYAGPRNTHSIAGGYLCWFFGFLGLHRFYY